MKFKQQNKKRWNYIDAKFPLHLDLEINSTCNSKCSFCPHSDNKVPLGVMPLEKARSLIREFAQGGGKSIKLMWRGEPTINNYLSEVLKYSKKNNLYTMLNTNGSFPYNNQDEIIDNLDWISFSIDKFHKNLNERILSRVCFFNTFTETEIQTHDNSEYLKIFCSINNIKLNVETPTKRSNKKYKVLNLNKMERTYCKFPSWRIIIDYLGHVIPCCVDWNKELQMGNVFISSISEIWNSKKYKKLRKELRKNIFTADICKKCQSKEAYK